MLLGRILERKSKKKSNSEKSAELSAKLKETALKQEFIQHFSKGRDTGLFLFILTFFRMALISINVTF